MEERLYFQQIVNKQPYCECDNDCKRFSMYVCLMVKSDGGYNKYCLCDEHMEGWTKATGVSVWCDQLLFTLHD